MASTRSRLSEDQGCLEAHDRLGRSGRGGLRARDGRARSGGGCECGGGGLDRNRDAVGRKYVATSKTIGIHRVSDHAVQKL